MKKRTSGAGSTGGSGKRARTLDDFAINKALVDDTKQSVKMMNDWLLGAQWYRWVWQSSNLQLQILHLRKRKGQFLSICQTRSSKMGEYSSLPAFFDAALFEEVGLLLFHCGGRSSINIWQAEMLKYLTFLESIFPPVKNVCHPESTWLH